MEGAILQYMHWVPSELVKLHKALALSNYSVDPSDRSWQAKASARRCGFKNLSAWSDHQKKQVAILERLISRPEMETFWAWACAQNPENSFPDRLFNWVMDKIRFWEKAAPYSKAERYKKLKEIAKLATELSNEIEKFALEPWMNFGYGWLLREGEIEQLAKLFRPEVLEKITRKGVPPQITEVMDQLFPPVDELLKRLSTVAKNSTKSEFSEYVYHPALPRKYHDKNAFRTYLITHVHAALLFFDCEPSPSKIAVFLSVALDDSGITADLVSKISPFTQDDKAFLAEFRSLDESR